MKVFETKKKVNAEAEQKKDREQLIEFINALARTTDRAMIKSAKEKQIEIFAYVDVIGRIGEYADNGQYKVAYDMLLQVASILEADAKTLISWNIMRNISWTHILLIYCLRFRKMRKRNGKKFRLKMCLMKHIERSREYFAVR